MLTEEILKRAIDGINELRAVFFDFQQMANFYCEIRGIEKPNKINHLRYSEYGDYFFAKCEFTNRKSEEYKFSSIFFVNTEIFWQKMIVDDYITEICNKANIANPTKPIYYLFSEDEEEVYEFNAEDNKDALTEALSWIVDNSTEEPGYIYGVWLKVDGENKDILIDTIEIA